MSLVTVIISTFNSSGFIEETLDSIYAQSWKEIELVITDDCSVDNTVEICRRWIEKYGSRFTDSIIVTSEVNTGVPANANRGLKKARAEWIKFLGADDTLKYDCIENNIHWIKSDNEIRILFSKVEIYRDQFLPENLIETTEDDSYDTKSIMAEGRSALSQYRMLLVSDRIHYTPSVFIHRETMLSVGGFDERFRLLEDYPLWLNLTGKGYRLYFMNKVTINYRMHSGAINNSSIPYLIPTNYFKTESFRKIYTYPFIPFDIRSDQRFKWIVSGLFRSVFKNKSTTVNKLIFSFLTVYLNPFRYLIWLRKNLNRQLKENEFYM